jgi:hypothetical protein
MHSPLSNLQDTTNTKRTMTCVWKDRCHRHHAYHLQALVSGGSATARHWQPELVGSASESAVPGAPVFTATILRKRLGDSIDCPLDGLEIAAARNHLVEVCDRLFRAGIVGSGGHLGSWPGPWAAGQEQA